MRKGKDRKKYILKCNGLAFGTIIYGQSIICRVVKKKILKM